MKSEKRGENMKLGDFREGREAVGGGGEGVELEEGWGLVCVVEGGSKEGGEGKKGGGSTLRVVVV